MRVVINSEEELLDLAKELLYVMANMRHWQDQWSKHYGKTLLAQKKKWEVRADELLERLKTTRSVHKYDVHIKYSSDDQRPDETKV